MSHCSWRERGTPPPPKEVRPKAEWGPPLGLRQAAAPHCSPPPPRPHSRPLPTSPAPGAQRSPGFGRGAGARRVTVGAGRPLVRAGRTAPGGPEPSRGWPLGAGSPPGGGSRVCRLGPGQPELQPGGVRLGGPGSPAGAPASGAGTGHLPKAPAGHLTISRGAGQQWKSQ